MKIQRGFAISGLGMSLALFTAMGASAVAQDAAPQAVDRTAEHAAPQTGKATVVEGMIIGRDGPAMAVRTAESPRLIVVLGDNVKATEKGGFLGMSKKNHDMADLVPGLAVKVTGTYDSDHRLVAKDVVFSRGSMKTAKQIDAGLAPTQEEIAAAKDELRTQRKDIEATQAGLDKANQDIAANAQGLNENKQAVTATNGRIGQLDQYETKNTLTVNFKNGSAVVSKKDHDALADFAKTAAATPGALIEVQGYASKVGKADLNQKLSSERATNVLTIIQQAGVPLTRILPQAAMGTVEQVASNHSRSGQAQNRRVVVTVVVNKGITSGGEDASSTTAAPAPAPQNQPGQ